MKSPDGPLWILSWDGATPWLADRALAEGATPNLAKLRARGSSAAGSTADHPDVSTPPGHATLWTGRRASEHGITSFRVPTQPDGAHDLLHWTNGFDARLLKADPLWVTAARAGLTATLVHTPLSGPIEAWEDPARFGQGLDGRVKVLHGYGPQRFPAGLVKDPALRPTLDWKGLPFDTTGALEFQFRAKPLSVPALALPGDGGVYDRLYLAADKSPGAPGVFVYPGREADFSPLLRLDDTGAVRFRLLAMNPDASGIVLFSTESFEVECLPHELLPDYYRALGPFRGVGQYRMLGAGDFGPTYADGEAEFRYMETHRQALEHFEDTSVWACEHHPADLMIFYNPGIDETQHNWAGYVQAGERSFDGDKAEKVWPWIREAYRRADHHLGLLLDRLPEGGRLLLVSDHGISGIHSHFLPNTALKEAGLLHTLRGNPYKIDLKRTKAIYHPANNSYVFINSERYPRGVVPDDEREAVIDEVRRVLMAVKDPVTGESVLAHVVRIDHLPEDSEMRGQGRGDLFLALKPGYSLGDTLHRQALLPANLAGHHQQHPGLRSNHALFEAVGPGIRGDFRCGVVSHCDVHETARRLLGLAPGEGPGEALTQILEESEAG